MGKMREAEAIEQQAMSLKQQQQQQQPQPQAAPAPAIQQPQPAGGVQQDFSQQWIEYYRSQGMHAEADKFEAQLKSQKPQPPSTGAPAGAPVYGGQYNPAGY
jgi:hypothetical protein